MNNTIPFHSAPHAPQITVDVNILSMLKQAASCLSEMASENVYLAAIGGAGALLSSCVKKAEIIAYEDLGAEAIRRLEVEDLPVTVIIDAQGNNLYETGRSAYLETVK